MADPRPPNTETSKPGVSEHARDVYGTISHRIFSRAEAMYGVQCSLPGGRDTNML